MCVSTGRLHCKLLWVFKNDYFYDYYYFIVLLFQKLALPYSFFTMSDTIILYTRWYVILVLPSHVNSECSFCRQLFLSLSPTEDLSFASVQLFIYYIIICYAWIWPITMEQFTGRGFLFIIITFLEYCLL